MKEHQWWTDLTKAEQLNRARRELRRMDRGDWIRKGRPTATAWKWHCIRREHALARRFIAAYPDYMKRRAAG